MDYTQYTELLPHHCNVLLFQGSMKTFQHLFSFCALKKISQVHQVCRNYPSLITFNQLWRNSSQLVHPFKVNVALSPDLKAACWFAKIYLLASVQKQQRRLSASAVKCEIAMPWKWTIQAFLRIMHLHNAKSVIFSVAFISFCKRTLHIFVYVCLCVCMYI